MTRFDFMKYVSNQTGQFHGSYMEDELKCWISEAYDGKINTEKIVDFFLGVGHLYFNSIEKISGDKLEIDLRWLKCIEYWEDIGCAVNSLGFILNCSGRIEQFYISEHGKFYNRERKLIAENEEDFFDYITTVEYDYHPVIPQRTYDMLRFFGWYEGRHIDTTAFEQEMDRRGIKLSEKQLAFFSEFSGLVFDFAGDIWYFYSLDKIMEQEKVTDPVLEKRNPRKYPTVLCGNTMGGPLAVDSEGIIRYFYDIPWGRTTMECINHLCEDVPEDYKWIPPDQD